MAANPGVKASASYAGSTYTAVSAGVAGNSIVLTFDGAMTNQQVVNAWNGANLENLVQITAGSMNAISAAGSLTLLGGVNPYDPNTDDLDPNNDTGSRNVEPRNYSNVEPLLNVETFKRRYLFGVNLVDRTGTEISDDTIQDFINIAIDYVETELNVPIFPKQLTHYEDYDFAQYRNYMFIQLPIYPIVSGSVTKVNLEFNPTVKIEFPESWYKVYEKSGQLNLLPSVSTISAVLIQASGMLIPRAISSEKAPQLLRIDYKAGLCDENDCVPPFINHVIGYAAGIYLLQMLGDIGPLGEPGVSGYNLSLDNLSQNINTAISATANIYGATISAYQRLLDKTYLPLLKRRYKRLRVEFI